MKLSQILRDVEVSTAYANLNQDIDEINYDSRTKTKNSLFFCLKGEGVDRHNFIAEAKNNGAICAVCEKYVPLDIPFILVKDCRKALAKMAYNFYKIDKSKLKVIGVTGTNGKTTTTYIIRDILSALGKSVGIIGSNGVFFNDKKIDTNMTTPDSDVLFKAIADMQKDNIEYIVMEVSAHASYYEKVYGLKFDVMALTNITQDHLDFFKDMQNYINSKLKLLDHQQTNSCVINIDDENVAKNVANINSKSITISTKKNADYCATNIVLDADKTTAVLNGNKSLISKKLGLFNLYNVLSAAACCVQLGCDIDAVLNVIEKESFDVPGRYDLITSEKGYKVVVDYAHTPDGLKNILTSLKELNPKKLLCVFGCGGNRDRTKRPLMGAIAAEICDKVYITSDNPRGEEPDSIISEIISGINNHNIVQITDRKQAIVTALEDASEGDIVAICGKGAEDYQEINGKKTHFSDYEVINEHLHSLE